MIHISHLTKTFCSASALSNVNLEIYTSDKYKKGMFPLLLGIGHTAKRNLIWSDGISHYVLDLNTEEKEELLSIYSEEMTSLFLSPDDQLPEGPPDPCPKYN